MCVLGQNLGEKLYKHVVHMTTNMCEKCLIEIREIISEQTVNEVKIKIT